MENKLKYLEKYTNENKSRKEKKRSNIIIIDEEVIHNTQEKKISENETKLEEKIIWKEMDEEENEDEIKALEIARREMRHDSNHSVSEDDNEIIGNKRRRHDSDSEEAESVSESGTENELDELINEANEENSIKDDKKKTGLILEFNKNKVEKKSEKDYILLHKEREKLKKETTYRDELGRKIKKSETKEEKLKKLEKINYSNLEKWSKGIIQKEEELKRKEEIRKVKNEPFARHDIDIDAEKELIDKSRFGDPMKGLISMHKYEKGINTSEVGRKIISRGFYLPKCKFSGPANRFGIKPGYRWDGVDRGTGYETKYLQSINTIRSKQEEYHKLRTGEM